FSRDWSSDVCSSDLETAAATAEEDLTAAQAALTTAEEARDAAQADQDAAQTALTDAQTALADATAALDAFFAEGGPAAEFESGKSEERRVGKGCRCR